MLWLWWWSLAGHPVHHVSVFQEPPRKSSGVNSCSDLAITRSWGKKMKLWEALENSLFPFLVLSLPSSPSHPPFSLQTEINKKPQHHLRKIKRQQLKEHESKPQITICSAALRWIGLHRDRQGRALWAMCAAIRTWSQGSRVPQLICGTQLTKP